MSEKWITESKMETQTFAELRVVALWPDRHEIDSKRQIILNGGKDFLLNFTV